MITQTYHGAARFGGEHERAWDQAGDLRAALETTRDLLTQYARLMAGACGVPDLLEEVVVPQRSGTGG